MNDEYNSSEQEYNSLDSDNNQGELLQEEIFLLDESVDRIKDYLELEFHDRRIYMGEGKAREWAWNKFYYFCSNHKRTIESLRDNWTRLRAIKWMRKSIGVPPLNDQLIEKKKPDLKTNHENVINQAQLSSGSDLSITKSNDESKESMDKDRIIQVQNDIIKRLKRDKKFSKRPVEQELREMADKSRMKNGKINYFKLSKLLGKSHPTAKQWCKDYKIK